MIRIPKTGTNNQPMKFYHVTSETEMERLTRHDFFKLIRETPNGEEHVLPDFDDAVTYFIPDGENYAAMSRLFCKEADRQRKQYVRHHECVLKGTPMCDGWTDDPDREHHCDACTRKHTCRTISLNETLEDSDGNEIEFGSTLQDDLSDSIEEIAQHQNERDILRTVLGCLPEEDRKYILTCFGDDMNFIKLAEMYGIDRHYASKRAGRIEDRIKKAIEKM